MAGIADARMQLTADWSTGKWSMNLLQIDLVEPIILPTQQTMQLEDLAPPGFNGAAVREVGLRPHRRELLFWKGFSTWTECINLVDGWNGAANGGFLSFTNGLGQTYKNWLVSNPQAQAFRILHQSPHGTFSICARFAAQIIGPYTVEEAAS